MGASRGYNCARIQGEYKVITLQEFYDRLAAHDWSYQYSDDHRHWTKGREEQRALINILNAYKGTAYEKLYNDYRTWFFSSDGDVVKPVRPE